MGVLITALALMFLVAVTGWATFWDACDGERKAITERDKAKADYARASKAAGEWSADYSRLCTIHGTVAADLKAALSERDAALDRLRLAAEMHATHDADRARAIGSLKLAVERLQVKVGTAAEFAKAVVTELEALP